jgi:signal transduction histidine kinase
MQIRYKITLAYATTVAVIFLFFSIAIYYLSAQNRVSEFEDRLEARALTNLQLLTSEKLPPNLVKKINRSSTGGLNQKSVSIYDSSNRLIFSDNDRDAPPLSVNAILLQKTRRTHRYSFSQEERDVLAFVVNKNIVVVAAYDDDRIEWLVKLRLILFVCYVSSIAIILFVGYGFSLRLVKAISKLRDNLNHISSKDLSLRLNAGGKKDELEQLAATINNLLSRLQHSFQTQSRFIDNASHELSTPLAVIISQLDIARQKERSKEEYERLVNSLHEDVTRLSILVRSLLDLAKISGSAAGLELQPIRIDDLLMLLPVEMKKVNEAYKVKMIFEEFPEQEDAMLVYGNGALLFCAFQNIVHNACKYSDDHVALIRLSFDAKDVNIDIEDNGPGIESEDLENIYQPFFRAAAVKETVPGTGLGLSLARNIIRLHNGTITIDSVPGTGTVCHITLPVDRNISAHT